jgi:hypothetical protein
VASFCAGAISGAPWCAGMAAEAIGLSGVIALAVGSFCGFFGDGAPLCAVMGSGAACEDGESDVTRRGIGGAAWRTAALRRAAGEFADIVTSL